MAKLVNIKKSNYDVYIGRPSIWGNPFSHKEGTLAKYKVDSVKEAIIEYEKYLLNNQILFNKLESLKNKTLGCYCTECIEYKDDDKLICHGQILLKYIQKYYPLNPLF